MCVTSPVGTASPNAWVSWSSSPSRTPASACRPLLRIDTNPFHQGEVNDERIVGDRQARKGVPPLRTATGRPRACPNFTAAITSATPAQRTMSAGCLSNGAVPNPALDVIVGIFREHELATEGVGVNAHRFENLAHA